MSMWKIGWRVPGSLPAWIDLRPRRAVEAELAPRRRAARAAASRPRRTCAARRGSAGRPRAAAPSCAAASAPRGSPPGTSAAGSRGRRRRSRRRRARCRPAGAAAPGRAQAGRRRDRVGDERVAVARERRRLDERVRAVAIRDDDVGVLGPDREAEEVVGLDDLRAVLAPAPRRSTPGLRRDGLVREDHELGLRRAASRAGRGRRPPYGFASAAPRGVARDRQQHPLDRARGAGRRATAPAAAGPRARRRAPRCAGDCAAPRRARRSRCAGSRLQRAGGGAAAAAGRP